MAQKGTYINQHMKWKIKEFAVEQVAKRVTLSPLGQEYLDMIVDLAKDMTQAARMMYPLEDMMVLKKYHQHDFAGVLVVDLGAGKSDLWVPLVPKKFLQDCLTCGSPIRHYNSSGTTRTLRKDIPRYFPEEDVAEIVDLYEGKPDKDCDRKHIHREDTDWPLDIGIFDICDLAETKYGAIVSGGKTMRQSINLFTDHRTPEIGLFARCTVERAYWHPYQDKVDSGVKIWKAMNDEIKKYVCAYEVLIEKKRTIEALMELWPDLKEYVAKTNLELHADGCPKMDMADAEALVRQDLAQPTA